MKPIIHKIAFCIKCHDLTKSWSRCTRCGNTNLVRDKCEGAFLFGAKRDGSNVGPSQDRS